jgi:hypothetical protein
MKKISLSTETSPIALRTAGAAGGFDLGFEAAQLLQDFPAFGENTIFALADAESFDPRSPELYGHPQALLQDKISNNASMLIRNAIKDGSSIVMYQNIWRGYKNNIVAVIPDGMLNKTADITGIPAFDHEAGHLVTPNGRDDRLNEASADAYMALRLFQRQGEGAVEPLSRISAKRAFDFFVTDQDEAYLTTPVIDRIIQDSKSIDFKALSPEETAGLASQYARNYFPSEDDLEDVVEDGRRYSGMILEALGDPEKHHKLPNVILSALSFSHALSFQVAAKAFQPFLNPEGADLDDKKIVLPDDIREQAQSIILDRAKRFDMQEQFQVALTPRFNAALENSATNPETSLSQKPQILAKPKTTL